MFDGLKMQDVALLADCNGVPTRLTFGALVDEQTGFILDPTRRAIDRGLIFRLVPRRTGQGYRVEVKGSLHKFHNHGEHNADQFTATDLLQTLDQLVTTYGIDPFTSKINTVEFGVNLQLPFLVSRVLDNLICYKNQPFAKDSHSLTPYYICQRQRYAVKLYDKGKQKGLAGNLLRFEIRVRKMRYFDGTGVQLHTLADLLNVANYHLLGTLLVDTFNAILFDDSTIIPGNLTARQQSIYQQCRNPRYWHTPDNLTPQQAATHRQQLSRNKKRFRALLDQYGTNWQGDVTALIGQTWAQLTAVDDELLTRIDQHKTAWQNGSKPDLLTQNAGENYIEENKKNRGERCHNLTDFTPANCHNLTAPSTPGLSQINPLYSGVHCDSGKPAQPLISGVVICPVTRVSIDQPQPQQRFVSATMLRNNDDLLLTLDSQHRQYAKGSKEDEFSRAAHNVRNTYNNPRHNSRNNLKRSINKIHRQPTLFNVADTLRLTDDQRALLNT